MFSVFHPYTSLLRCYGVTCVTYVLEPLLCIGFFVFGAVTTPGNLFCTVTVFRVFPAIFRVCAPLFARVRWVS